MHYHTDLLPGIPTRKLPANRRTPLRKQFTRSKTPYCFFKRAFDIFFSVVFIAGILSWLLPVIGVLIMIDSRGPVFFVQRRVGRNGRLFSCLKFRTMILNNEADEKQADDNDYRITRMGKFLRKTNIDEFPQFLNILVGDMSIIGPRPHMLSDCTRFSFVIPGYDFRTVVRPGITGLAQVKGYHGPTRNYESIYIRYHWDEEYIRNANFWLDLKIIALTFFHGASNIFYIAGSYVFAKKN
jgi:putative colanic acid biosynthesis UDP-glucose lipid carrier transferase